MIPIGFTGGWLDRADDVRLDTARIAALAADPAARVLRLEGGDPALDGAGRLQWDRIDGCAPALFLGFNDGAPRFARFPLPEVRDRWAVYGLIDRMRPGDAAIWAAARSIADWHGRHGFCSICGAPSEVYRAGWGRKCPSCGGEHYPRVDPVVIMLPEHDGRVLLGRQSNYPPGRYSALAGYVEPGESIEEAVAREVLEEAGVEVADVRYIASQPWPFSGALMIACLATAKRDAITVDRNELEDAKWVDEAGVRAALAGAADAPFNPPSRFAIAHSLLLHWLGERERLAGGNSAA